MPATKWSQLENCVVSRCEPLRVSGEHRRFPDVVQASVEHANSLHANAATGVRGTTIPVRKYFLFSSYSILGQPTNSISGPK